MKFAKRISFFVLALSQFINGFGQIQSEDIQNTNVVTTYECASIYGKTPENRPCKIRYKELKDNFWKDGSELVYDSRDSEYCGSIVSLTSNTEYQTELSTVTAKTQLKFKTRNDNFPIGKITILPVGKSDTTIVNTQSGTPDAYHLVTVPEKSKFVLNLKNICNNGIEIDADYVIVRGIEIRNAKIHGIRIRTNRHDIVIEQCHITFWGRIGGPNTYGNLEGAYDSYVWADRGTENITVQRNLIEDPRGASNDWETGHRNSMGGSLLQKNNLA